MESQTLTIGRSRDADIQIRDETVRRRHAELTVTRNGRYYVTDCGSLRGTRVFRGGEWTALRQGYVDPDERLRFGKFETKLAHLLEDNATKSKPTGQGQWSLRPVAGRASIAAKSKTDR